MIEKVGQASNTLLETKGLYDIDSKVALDEVLNHKNERVVRGQINPSTSDFVRVDATLYNYFSELKAVDFAKAEDGSYTYSGDLAATLAEDFVSFYGEVTSAKFMMENDKFTSFEFTFADKDGAWIGSDFSSARFKETLAVKGTFAYEGMTLKDLKPVANNKIAALDNALAAFKDKSFAIQPVNPDYIGEEGACMAQVLYDGDKIVADFVDMMTFELGSLSWLDSVFEKDEEKGTYFINNVSLNEDDGSHFWQSTKEVIEAAGDTPSESSITFAKDAFALDFANIDSSLFTAVDGEANTYNLKPEAVKYFGECVVPVFMDYSAIYTLGMVQPLEGFTSQADSWKVKILDDGSLVFIAHAQVDFGGSQAGSEWAFVISGAGTTDVTSFYEGELPPPMEM